MTNKGMAQLRFERYSPPALPTLPTGRPVYWLQTDKLGDEVLPTGAVYKLACSPICLERAEIICTWPHHDHRFVIVPSRKMKGGKHDNH